MSITDDMKREQGDARWITSERQRGEEMDGEIVDLVAIWPNPDASFLSCLRHVLGLQEGLQLGIGRENERFNQRHHFSFELIQLFHRERSLLGLLGPGERTIERALL